MPESYKSFGTLVGTTGATIIYSGVTGTALVNAIQIANNDVNNTNYITVELVKGSTAYSLITQAQLPSRTSLQVLDAPLALESGNQLRYTSGYTFSTHVIVSLMEIT
tara:strand:- start:251 stop:571 length:321 start_codon:yes stop_codon:yes gene_type:complete